MKHTRFLFLILLISSGIALMVNSCGKSKSQGCVNADYMMSGFITLDMDIDEAYYDSVFSLLGQPRLLPLKEDDEVMFANLERLVAKDNKFFIVDTYGNKTVVSFTKDGNAYAKYGKIGQGPGEYFRPWDINVRGDNVYILDSNTKKVLRYKISGEYVEEKTIPFIAQSFHILDNGNVLFCILPEGDGSPRLCLADSNMKVLKNYIPSKPGYVGGWGTTNIFQTGAGGYLSYYESPQDTIYILNEKGEPISGYVLDFGDKAMPEESRINWFAYENGISYEGKRMLRGNLIPLANGYMAELILEDRKQYVTIMQPEKRKCGGKLCKLDQSVYDIMEPVSVDEDGNLIAFMDNMMAQRCHDYDMLPDSIKCELEKGNRVLMIYDFSRL